jgi:hypothetical protein
MASIEKRSSDTEIDYQYPDEQIDSESSFDKQKTRGPKQRAPGIFQRLPKKKMMVAVLVIMVLFGVYQMLTPKDEHEARVPQTKATPQKQQSQAVPQSTAPEVSTPSLETQRQPMVNLSPVDGTQAGRVEDQIQSISQEVVELKETLSALVSTLEVMAVQVQELRHAQQSRPSTFMPFKPKNPYFLKAVIKGRAWLESTDGNLITVKEGDAIPEYGTINKIDHNEGWVETSSGLIIGYGRNDS